MVFLSISPQADAAVSAAGLPFWLVLALPLAGVRHQRTSRLPAPGRQERRFVRGPGRGAGELCRRRELVCPHAGTGRARVDGGAALALDRRGRPADRPLAQAGSPVGAARAGHHRRGRADPPVQCRLHAVGRRVRALFRLPQPVRRVHARAGPRQLDAGDVHRLGRGGTLLLPADRLLVPRNGQCRCRQEGIHHESHWRPRVPARDVPDLAGARHAGFRRARQSCHAVAGQRCDRHRDRPLHRARMRRQVGADSALYLAARRDGRPHAGICTDPCGHDGHRRRVPGGADQCHLRVVAHRRPGRGDDRRSDRALRGHHRPAAERHQEGAGLLDRLAAGAHVPRRGKRRLCGRHLSPGDARLLQGRAVPRRRQRHSRHARRLPRHPFTRRRAGHAQHGWPPAVDAVDLGPDVDRDACDRGHTGLCGLLLEGRDPRLGVCPRRRAGRVLRPVGARLPRVTPDGAVHGAPHGTHLPWQQPDRERGAGAPARSPLDHDRAAGGPGAAEPGGWAHQPAVDHGWASLARVMARTGARTGARSGFDRGTGGLDHVRPDRDCRPDRYRGTRARLPGCVAWHRHVRVRVRSGDRVCPRTRRPVLRRRHLRPVHCAADPVVRALGALEDDRPVAGRWRRRDGQRPAACRDSAGSGAASRPGNWAFISSCSWPAPSGCLASCCNRTSCGPSSSRSPTSSGS